MTNYDILKEYEEHQTPVPTYKELQQIKESVEKMKDVVLNTVMNNMKSIIEIVNITKENTQLKEQLEIAIEALKCYEQENWTYADEYNYFRLDEYTGGWCHAEKALKQIKELEK